MSLPIYLVVQDTDTRITVSSISDVSCFNPERVITIKGNIPNISQAEAEVGTTSCTAACSVIVTLIYPCRSPPSSARRTRRTWRP